ncbi:hypothetical protein [Paenibacillus senegalensis]|uniref:hypothetical protein n=1 Tax=Paenibacillus senegalensis TaxID=1465766 RepID=UPI0002893729|nr:hypothetical protein [Paenibacillus senegalensis]
MLTTIAILYLVLAAFSAIVILKQQKTIERLTDRLMARDYKEYKTMTDAPKSVDEPKREPLSWYDDRDIED